MASYESLAAWEAAQGGGDTDGVHIDGPLSVVRVPEVNLDLTAPPGVTVDT